MRFAKLSLGWGALLALLAGPATPHLARAELPKAVGLPSPPGSRVDGDRLISGRGFRDSVDLYAKHLDRKGIAHQAPPIVSFRGVDLARFLAAKPQSWAAIHVYRASGVTYVFVVPPPPLTTPKGEGK